MSLRKLVLNNYSGLRFKWTAVSGRNNRRRLLYPAVVSDIIQGHFFRMCPAKDNLRLNDLCRTHSKKITLYYSEILRL